MFDKPISTKVKDLVMISDKTNLKILCALGYLSEKGDKECIDKTLSEITKFKLKILKEHCDILEKTGCITIENKNIPKMSPHNFYQLTNYGRSLLNNVGINKHILQNEIKRNG